MQIKKCIHLRAFPNSKALPAGFGATPQLRRLALSDTSIRRKRHESVMSIELIRVVEGRFVIAHVHDYLRRQVLNGTIPPGSVLAQIQLAQQLGVSRTPRIARSW